MTVLVLAVVSAPLGGVVGRDAAPPAQAVNWFADPTGPTTFDLGIDVSNIPPYKEYVGPYVKRLAPETQHILARTCQTYLGARMFDATSYNTIQFCRALFGQQ